MRPYEKTSENGWKSSISGNIHKMIYGIKNKHFLCPLLTEFHRGIMSTPITWLIRNPVRHIVMCAERTEYPTPLIKKNVIPLLLIEKRIGGEKIRFLQ